MMNYSASGYFDGLNGVHVKCHISIVLWDGLMDNHCNDP